jgi:magnesium chelatase subunit D
VSQAISPRDPFEIAELQNPLMRGLACAALSPGLRSLLVFDASPTTLETMAGLLAQMVAVVTEGDVVLLEWSAKETERRVVPIQLGTVETEEELWGSLSLGQDIAARTVVWKPGLLAAGRGQEIRIVVIPDLSRLSLAASRACVMLMGSEVAHLERHGQRDRWQPQLYWLAGCDQTRIGVLSPHLLDRFALRLSGGEYPNSSQRPVQLGTWLRQFDQPSPSREKEDETYSLSPELVTRLQQVKSNQPEVLPEARERVLDYLELSPGYSPRRDLALLHLARSNAQLSRLAQVREEDVDNAADIINLSLPQAHTEDLSPEAKTAESDSSTPATQTFDQGDSSIQQSTSSLDHPTPVFKSDTQQTFPSASLPMGSPIVDPYLEDVTEPEREAASLRLPPRRFKSASMGRGAIIGVEPTMVPQDLALVSTLLEAAKYQKLRWDALQAKGDQSEWVRRRLGEREANGHSPLILQTNDLRRYRRAAMPEHLLTLVVDYTSLKDCQWQEALLPYLQWAYVERASVCLVQMGAADAQNELRAEKREANTVLVPRIRNRLEASRGRATPLAHGLDLALQTLRHGLQHGRSAVQKAVLVVISDGRGNVPLAASRTGKITLPVGRQGIEDALNVARQIAALKKVEAVVLNPQPKHCIDLPVELAQALGAKIAKIPTINAWEVKA